MCARQRSGSQQLDWVSRGEGAAGGETLVTGSRNRKERGPEWPALLAGQERGLDSQRFAARRDEGKRGRRGRCEERPAPGRRMKMRAGGREAQLRGQCAVCVSQQQSTQIIKAGSGLLRTSEKRMGGGFHCSQGGRNPLQLAGEKPANNN